uniref:HAT C-terminal dimerisation domain-containing protein n=1 Tax=Lactuca sativa TaxID=4236 RepID=A0A9R1XSF7_LACSA|nr:hypothetical protein LSAT_V11C300113540 [Lactuca sativa]
MDDLIVQTNYPSVSIETELTQYLNDQLVKYNKEFDILLWWKQNTFRYLIYKQTDIRSIPNKFVRKYSRGCCLHPRLGMEIKKAILENIDEILKDDEVAKALEKAINNEYGKGKQLINILE